MPLAEMSGDVTRAPEGLRDGLFLCAQRIPVRKHPRAFMRTTGQDRGAGRRTDRTAGVEALESKPVRRHRVEVRRLEYGVVPVAGLTPAHVVSHDEDDIGLVGGLEGGAEEAEAGEEGVRVHGLKSVRGGER